jgi:hypothetical protein
MNLAACMNHGHLKYALGADRAARVGKTYCERFGIRAVFNERDTVGELLAVEMGVLPGEWRAWGWCGNGRTSSVAISWRMSMTSRAALRRASAEACSAGMLFVWFSGGELRLKVGHLVAS